MTCWDSIALVEDTVQRLPEAPEFFHRPVPVRFDDYPVVFVQSFQSLYPVQSPKSRESIQANLVFTPECKPTRRKSGQEKQH
jgi:hypothetical protein